MRCPRCAFKGKPFQGHCAVCGSPLQEDTQISAGITRINQQSSPNTGQPTSSMEPYTPRIGQTSATNWHMAIQTTGPGKVLRSGRYTLIESVTLPQQNQGMEEQDSYFLVFLWPQGRSLAQLLKRGALPEHTAAEYGWQMCDVLSLLADQHPPLMHGAISPETIIISENGKQAVLFHLPILPLREFIGHQGTPPGYRAPEQVHGTLTPSSDLYALAATLYHAVTGSDPQERPPAFYPPARRINSEVSATMERILARQLRLSSTQRYSSAYEMQQDLAALIESYPTQASKSVARIHALTAPVQAIENEESLELPRRFWRRLMSLFMGTLMAVVG